mgnify:CR=1 FL=1
MALIISARSTYLKNNSRNDVIMNARHPTDHDLEDALQKLRYFCSFQERHTAEVKGKLVSLGVPAAMHEPVIERLRAEKFLDNTRFAGAFARGKFRINKWGRKKIRHELAGRGIPEAVIIKGLEEIDEAEYMDTLRELVSRKFKEIKGEKKLTVRNKILTFVTGKGYETDLVLEAINELKI